MHRQTLALSRITESHSQTNFQGIEENGTRSKSVEAEYKNRRPAKQFFELIPNNATFQRFVLRILTNQGNSEYTCVYRVHMYKNVESR